MDTRERKRIAKQLLIHYFRTTMRAAGLQFDSDNEAEIGEIIDLIFSEIADECSAVDERRERLAATRARCALDFDAWRSRNAREAT